MHQNDTTTAYDTHIFPMPFRLAQVTVQGILSQLAGIIAVTQHPI